VSIGLFIDGSYIFKVFPDHIDYVKLRNFIEQDLNDEVDEAYFFNADDDPPKATKYNQALTTPPPNGPGFRLKIYWLRKKKLYWPTQLGGQPVLHPDDPTRQYELIQQKGVDVGLTYNMVRSFSKRKWTKLVLGAGDGDFHEPVQNLVESENVDLYLLGSMRSTSSELKPYARKLYEIDQEPMLSRLKR